MSPQSESMVKFIDTYGRTLNPISPIFPILTGDPATKRYIFRGTGFFINTFGGFLTAKHVLYRPDGSHINPFFAITTHQERQYVRYLDRSFPHPTADVCFGLLRRDAHLEDRHIEIDFPTPVMQVLENEPEAGDMIQTFAYPNSSIALEEDGQWGNFLGEWFDGRILNIHPYRDATFYPYRVIESDMTVLSGASGGPVMKGAYVIGVNSSGVDLGEEGGSISYITPISFAHQIEVEVNGEKFALGDRRVRTQKGV